MISEGLSKQLKFGSELHKRILMEVQERARFSKRKQQDYYARWEEIDDDFRAYIPEAEVDRVKKESRKERKKLFDKVDYVTLSVPYNYAVMSTYHTYLATIFLSRTPVYQLTGRHGESQDKVMTMEALMDYQYNVGQHAVPLFNWLFDHSKYGIGYIGTYWDREVVTTSEFVEVQAEVGGVESAYNTRYERRIRQTLGYQGNRLFNIRPQDALPDPRVSAPNLQKGEFFGYISGIGWHDLEGSPGLINLDQLRKQLSKPKPSGTGQDKEFSKEQGGTTYDLPYQPGENDGSEYLMPGFIDLMEMYVRINPKKWGVGKNEDIEIWKFTIADNKIVIEARPLGLNHDKFPFAALEFGFGSDEYYKMPLMEYTKPLTDVITWLFNSHFYSVRTALNDRRVVDPSMVYMSDVEDRDLGIIRLRPEAYGAGTDKAVTQLKTQDPTSQNIMSAQYVEQMIQRVGGVVDNLMGMVNTGGRKTATEVRNATGMATNRLKTPAEYGSAMGWQPLMTQMVQNTLQRYDGAMQLRVAGDLTAASGPIMATPESIAGMYDFIPVDGTLPIDRLAQGNFWKELIAVLAGSEGAMMSWDINSMIAHTMQLLGERNINKFRVQLGSPQQLAQQAQSGNVVPIGGGGANRTGTSGGTV